MTFEVVDRPNRGGGNISTELLRALLSTKDSGKAVKITLEKGTEFVNWQANVRTAVRKEGLRLRARHNKLTKVVHCWVEPFEKDRRLDAENTVDLGVNEDEEEFSDDDDNGGEVAG